MEIKNVVCWADIPAEDLDRAIKFYETVTAMKIEKMDSPYGPFGMFPHQDMTVGACLSQGIKPSKDGVLIYIDVTGIIDEAIKRVEGAGGKILEPRMEIGEYGSRAIILDSEGNRVALYCAPGM